MRNSHSSSLFHFTRYQEVIESILSTGLRVSYSGEQITEDIFIGIPMISFCDIPLHCCEEHREKYGDYAIGINKQWMIDYFGDLLSPVHYVLNEAPIVGAYKHHNDYVKAVEALDSFMESKKNSGTKKAILNGPNGKIYEGYTGSLSSKEDLKVIKQFNNILYAQDYANYALGITKNYICEHKGKPFCAYDECEWRIVIPENRTINCTKSRWFWNKKDYLEWKTINGNSFLGNVEIDIPSEAINHIVVPNEQSIYNFKEVLVKIGKSELSSKIVSIK